MQLQFASSALLAESDRVALYFFDGTQTCEAVTATPNRVGSEIGPFEATLDDDGRSQGVALQIDPIPVGTYLILVDALDAAGMLVGTGCVASQTIESGSTTVIEVVIRSA